MNHELKSTAIGLWEKNIEEKEKMLELEKLKIQQQIEGKISERQIEEPSYSNAYEQMRELSESIKHL